MKLFTFTKYSFTTKVNKLNKYEQPDIEFVCRSTVICKFKCTCGNEAEYY